MNIANKITLSRVILTFLFMFFLFVPGFVARIIALILFVLACITDYLDGWIATRRNIVTDFGKLMDPIADKILVVSAFAAFVQLGLIQAWMVVIIVAREILVTSLRLFALNKGKVLPAGRAGKHKTFWQMIIIFIILSFMVFKEVMLKYFEWNPLWDKTFRFAINLLMYLAVILTLYSGVGYFWQNRRVITKV